MPSLKQFRRDLREPPSWWMWVILVLVVVVVVFLR